MKKLLILFSLFVFGKVYSQTASFTMDADSGCAPVCVQFSGTSVNAVSWFWDFGDATQGSTVQSPMHCYSNPGIYTITLIVTFGNGPDTAFGTLYVFPNPTAGLSWTNIGNNTVQFTANTVGANTWLWHFGDQTTSTLQNPSHTYPNSGPFMVLLEVWTPTGCYASDTSYIGVVGINELAAESQWTIYPNPSENGIFTIQQTGTVVNNQISVYNTLGESILIGEFSGSFTLDLTTQPAGCYYIRTESGYTLKVIRQ